MKIDYKTINSIIRATYETYLDDNYFINNDLIHTLKDYLNEFNLNEDYMIAIDSKSDLPLLVERKYDNINIKRSYNENKQ